MPRTAKPKTTIEKRIYHVEFDMVVTVFTDPGAKQQSVEEMVEWNISAERLVQYLHNIACMASRNYLIALKARKPTYKTRLVRTFKKKIPYVVEIDEGVWE